MYAKGECNKQNRDVTILGIFKYGIQNKDERKTEDWGHCWSVCQLLRRFRWRQRLTGCWLSALAQKATSVTLRITSSCDEGQFRILLISLVLQIYHSFLIYTFRRCRKNQSTVLFKTERSLLRRKEYVYPPVFFFCSCFTAVIYTHIYIHIIHFHLFHNVNIYWNWLQEQFCNLSLYTLYILSV